MATPPEPRRKRRRGGGTDLHAFDIDQLGLGGPMALRDGVPARLGVLGWDDPLAADVGGLRQACWQDVDIAMIGSARLHRGLAPLCNPIALTPTNWRLVLEAVRPKLLLVDAFLTSFDGHWHLDQLHLADTAHRAPDGSIAQIVAAFRAAGIPTVFWNSLDVAYADRLDPLAAQFDLSFFSDGRHLDRQGGAAVAGGGHLPPACSPALHTPLAPAGRSRIAGREDPGQIAPPVLFDGWADILRHREALAFLEPLATDGLAVVEGRYRLYRNQLDVTGPLAGSILGCVTGPSLWALTRRAEARVFSTRTISTPHARHWDLVEAAACGTAIFQHGAPPPGGALDRAFEIHDSGADLVEALRARLADPVGLLAATQDGWRRAAGGASYAHRLQVICDRLGLGLRFVDQPKVTVLAVTFRLAFLPRILQQFDAQTYADKELALVVNSDEISEREVADRIGARDDVRIAVVPAERVEAGSLNHGIRMAGGGYVVKMDDDDLYGPNYVADMMLHARTHDLDLFGKSNRFLYFSEIDRTFERRHKRSLARIRSDELLATHIGGATLSGRTAFLRANPYPEGNFSATDTHYYANLQGRVDGRFAVLDDTGFVYWRRAASEHSWQLDNDRLMAQMAFVTEGVPEAVLG